MREIGPVSIKRRAARGYLLRELTNALPVFAVGLRGFRWHKAVRHIARTTHSDGTPPVFSAMMNYFSSSLAVANKTIKGARVLLFISREAGL